MLLFLLLFLGLVVLIFFAVVLNLADSVVIALGAGLVVISIVVTVYPGRKPASRTEGDIYRKS